jgi:tetratricopeptide (TPR) repeat protein
LDRKTDYCSEIGIAAFEMLTPDGKWLRAELNKTTPADGAVVMAKQELERAEKTFGPDHPEMAMALDNLAWLYYSQGQYATAEPLVKRALAIREKALGPEHPEVAAVLENISRLYEAMGKRQEAQQLSRRAEQIRQSKR